MHPKIGYRGYEEELLRKQIARAELSPEKNLKEMLRMQRDLGHVLKSQGRYRAAEDLAQRILGSYENHNECDKEYDRDRLDALNLLGEVLYHQGLFDEAENVFRHVLRKREAALGAEHPKMFHILNSVGVVLEEQRKFQEAEVIMRKLLERCEKVFGTDHLNTLSVINNLGIVLQKQEKVQEAFAMYQWALRGFDRILGSDHPDALTSARNFGTFLVSQSRFEEAEAMLKRALAGQEKVLGVEHPNTLSTVYGLAFLFHRQQRIF